MFSFRFLVKVKQLRVWLVFIHLCFIFSSCFLTRKASWLYKWVNWFFKEISNPISQHGLNPLLQESRLPSKSTTWQFSAYCWVRRWCIVSRATVDSRVSSLRVFHVFAHNNGSRELMQNIRLFLSHCNPHALSGNQLLSFSFKVDGASVCFKESLPTYLPTYLLGVILLTW